MPVAKNPDGQSKIGKPDENKKLPDDIAEPLQRTKTDDLDLAPEGSVAEGNVAAAEEEDTRELDGSNANNLRTK